MNFSDFRGEVLSRIGSCKGRRLDGFIHLLYAPEINDRLDLVQDGRRTSVTLAASKDQKKWPDQSRPRLITLDCHKVASYLFESDTAMDDPLLEASVTRVHEDLFGASHDEVLRINEQPGLVASPVCGWIISAENAARTAGRISALVGAHAHRHAAPLHLYNPEVIAGLWPALSHTQKKNLVGPSEWIICTKNELLQMNYTASMAADAPLADAQRVALSAEQLALIAHVPVVTALLANWKELNEGDGVALPPDARQQLHQHVKHARALGLDGDDLAIFAMTAVQLHPRATHSSEFLGLITEMRQSALALRDALQRLPDAFWDRYQLEVQGKS